MRFLRASGLAACLALAAVGNASAASSGFTGAWESIDWDGSYQVMTIGGVSASGQISRMTMFDSFGTVCVNVGAVSTTFHGLADVSIDGNDLWFTWRHVGCGDVEAFYELGGGQMRYDPSTGTVLDGSGITWTRQ